MIAAEVIDAVAARVATGDIDESTVSKLRADYADIHFTWCMEDDLGAEEPVRECDGFNIYLVDGEGHCLKLTTNAEVANGIVIAEVID